MSEFGTYQGGLFSEEVPDGRTGAEVRLGDRGILARTQEGREFRVGYRDCELDVGGASGRMVFCRSRDRTLTIFCEEKEFATALLRADGGSLAFQLEQLRSIRRGENQRGRRITSLVVLASLVLLVAGYFGLIAAARGIVTALPMKVDKQIGDLVMKSMTLEGETVRDPDVTSAITTIVDQLKPHAKIADIDFRIKVIDAPILNAFALPGGQIVVYTELIRKSESPEHVAGVLAHEMAHVTMRHGLERVAESVGLVAAIQLVLGDVGGLAALGVEILEMAAINSYSRDHEAEADEEGVRMMHDAGINPTGLAGFFDLLKEEMGDLPDAMAWISTHPQHDQRISAIQTQVDGLEEKVYSPLDLDWDDIRQRVGGDVQNKAEDLDES